MKPTLNLCFFSQLPKLVTQPSLLSLIAVGLVAVVATVPNPASASIASNLALETPKQNTPAQAFDAKGTFEKGNALFDAYKYGEAIQAYTLVIENWWGRDNQISAQARLKRSRAYVLAAVFGSPGYDNYDQSVGAAIVDCSRVINFQPKNPQGYTCRGFAYGYVGSLDEAFSDFSRAIQLAPNDPSIYYERGAAYIRSDKPGSAIADFTQVIKLDPKFDDAYYQRGLAYTYIRPADLQKASADFSQAIKFSPNIASYYKSRGSVRSSIGEYQGAVEDYTKVIQLAPGGGSYSGSAYSDRAFAFAALGKDDEAMADYNEAIRLVPKEQQAHYGRALIWAKRGDEKAAMAGLQQAKRNYAEVMGEANFNLPEYQRIIKAIEQLERNGKL